MLIQSQESIELFLSLKNNGIKILSSIWNPTKRFTQKMDLLYSKFISPNYRKYIHRKNHFSCLVSFWLSLLFLSPLLTPFPSPLCDEKVQSWRFRLISNAHMRKGRQRQRCQPVLLCVCVCECVPGEHCIEAPVNIWPMCQ